MTTNENPYSPPTTNRDEGSDLRPMDALSSAIDPKIVKRIGYIVRDAGNIVLVFVVPLCLPIFGILSTGWLAVRLIQWYQVNSRYKVVLDQFVAQKWSRKIADDFKLVKKFRSAFWSLWVGVLFWPVLVVALLGLLAFQGS